MADNKCPKCGGELEYSPDSSGWNCDACELLEIDWLKSQLAQAQTELAEARAEAEDRLELAETWKKRAWQAGYRPYRRLADQDGKGEE